MSTVGILECILDSTSIYEFQKVQLQKP